MADKLSFSNKKSIKRIAVVTLPKLVRPTNLLFKHSDDIHEFIVSGYIKNNNQDIPMKLKLIVVKYLGVIIRKFDIAPGEFLVDIKNNGTLIKRAKHVYKNRDKNKQITVHNRKFLFGCAVGFAPNTGFHRFSIKIKVLQIRQESIGIISDFKYLSKNEKYKGNGIILPKNFSIKSVKCNTYYLSLNSTNGVHQINSGKYTDNGYKCAIITYNSLKMINETDVISICMDTDNGKLYFEKNSKQYCDSINIDSKCTYYVAISSLAQGNEYELVV